MSLEENVWELYKGAFLAYIELHAVALSVFSAIDTFLCV